MSADWRPGTPTTPGRFWLLLRDEEAPRLYRASVHPDGHGGRTLWWHDLNTGGPVSVRTPDAVAWVSCAPPPLPGLATAFSRPNMDRVYMEALHTVAAEPMPEAPTTIYELRPNAPRGGRED